MEKRLEFDELQVTVMTILIKSDMTFECLDSIFNTLPITEYTAQKKKKKIVDCSSLVNGNIVSLVLRQKIRGVDLSKNKGKQEKGNDFLPNKKYFRNAMTVVMFYEKLINFKLSSNGKFQFTGCKTIDQAHNCIKFFIQYYLCDRKMTIHFFTIPVMRNIVFFVNYTINREKLDRLINEQTPWNSLFEASGYTGVNIKIPFEKGSDHKDVLTFEDEEWRLEAFDEKYDNYVCVELEKQKVRKNTFLVFQSGKIIMSGIDKGSMRPVFEKFYAFLLEFKNDIEDSLCVQSIPA